MEMNRRRNMSTLASKSKTFRCPHTDGAPYEMQVFLHNSTDSVSVETRSTGEQFCAYSGRRVGRGEDRRLYFGLNEAEVLYELLGQVLDRR
jgi:hypothetical protein